MNIPALEARPRVDRSEARGSVRTARKGKVQELPRRGSDDRRKPIAV